MPLNGNILQCMNRSFSYDFSWVRIYRCESGLIDADAFALGSDLFFCDGSYAPQTPGGFLLLAHELAHVIQQRSHGTFSGVGDGAGSIEADAWRATRVALAGGIASLGEAPMGIYGGSVPQGPNSDAARMEQLWRTAAGRVQSMDINRLAAIYVRLQMQDRNESMAFRQAAEPILMQGLIRMEPWAVILLAALRRYANRAPVNMLVHQARIQFERLQQNQRFQPAPLPNSGPSISADRGGGRPLTSYEQRVARGESGGDPFADNLADYIGTPPPVQMLNALRTAGPVGTLAAVVAILRGEGDAGIQNALAFGGGVDGLVGMFSPTPQQTPLSPQQDRQGIGGDRRPR